MNFVDYSDIATGKDRREIVFEFKGDLEFGIWGQYGYNLYDMFIDSSVIGVDYSWELGQNILVIIYERYFEKSVYSEFVSISCSLNEFSSIGSNMLFSSNSGEVYHGFIYNNIIDDYRSVELGYSRFSDNLYFGNNNSWDCRLIYRISF